MSHNPGGPNAPQASTPGVEPWATYLNTVPANLVVQKPEAEEPPMPTTLGEKLKLLAVKKGSELQVLLRETTVVPLAVKATLFLCINVHIFNVVTFGLVSRFFAACVEDVLHFQFHRLFLATYVHRSLFDLLLSCVSFALVGPDIENQLGTIRFGFLVIIIGILAHFFIFVMYEMGYYGCILSATDTWACAKKFQTTCTSGLFVISNALIALKATYADTNQVSCLFLFNMPTKLYPFVATAALTLAGVPLMEGVAGLAVGYLWAYGWLVWLVPPTEFVMRLEAHSKVEPIVALPGFSVCVGDTGTDIPWRGQSAARQPAGRAEVTVSTSAAVPKGSASQV